MSQPLSPVGGESRNRPEGPASGARDGAWWRHAVIYQIYPRSFADGDEDGMGDLAGIRARLPHLVDLGVDALWLSPWYVSPQADAGYDVADHCDRSGAEPHPCLICLDVRRNGSSGMRDRVAQAGGGRAARHRAVQIGRVDDRTVKIHQQW